MKAIEVTRVVELLKEDIARIRSYAANCRREERKWKRAGDVELTEWYQGRAEGLKSAARTLQLTVSCIEVGVV